MLGVGKRNNKLASAGILGENPTLYGAVAQLGERRVRNAEVGSSILLGSTNSTLGGKTSGQADPLDADSHSSSKDRTDRRNISATV